MKKNYFPLKLAVATLLALFAPAADINASAADGDGNAADGTTTQNFAKKISLLEGKVSETTGLPEGWTVAFPKASADQTEELLKTVSFTEAKAMPQMRGKVMKASQKTLTSLEYRVNFADLGLTLEMMASNDIMIYLTMDAQSKYPVLGTEGTQRERDSVYTFITIFDENDRQISVQAGTRNTIGEGSKHIFASSEIASLVPTRFSYAILTVNVVASGSHADSEDAGVYLGNVNAFFGTMPIRNIIIDNYDFNVIGEGTYTAMPDSSSKAYLYLNLDNEVKDKNIAWKDAQGQTIGTERLLEINVGMPPSKPATGDDDDDDEDDDEDDDDEDGSSSSEMHYTVWCYNKLRSMKVTAEGNGQASLSSNGGFSGTESRLCPGETITCRATSTPTSLFAYWKDKDNNVVSNDSVYTFRLTEGDEENVMTAVFQQLDKKVAFTIPERWSTFYYHKDITMPKNVWIYSPTKISDDGKSILVPMPFGSNLIPAYTPVLLENDSRQPVTLTLYTCDNPVSGQTDGNTDGLLRGTTVDTTAPDSSYVFKEVGGLRDFYLYDATSKAPQVEAFHCWLEIGDNDFHRAMLALETKTTGISSVKNDDTSAMDKDDNAIYNLAGQKVTTPQRGHLYIKNGRKLIWQ